MNYQSEYEFNVTVNVTAELDSQSREGSSLSEVHSAAADVIERAIPSTFDGLGPSGRSEYAVTRWEVAEPSDNSDDIVIPRADLPKVVRLDNERFAINNLTYTVTDNLDIYRDLVTRTLAAIEYMEAARRPLLAGNRARIINSDGFLAEGDVGRIINSTEDGNLVSFIRDGATEVWYVSVDDLELLLGGTPQEGDLVRVRESRRNGNVISPLPRVGNIYSVASNAGLNGDIAIYMVGTSGQHTFVAADAVDVVERG